MNFPDFYEIFESATLYKNKEEQTEAFFNELGKIPQDFANLQNSFLEKFLALKEKKFNEAIKYLLENKMNCQNQFKLIKFFDFLIATASKTEDFDEIFNDNLINSILIYKYDFSDSDVLCSYSNFLKSISIKLDKININYLFLHKPFKFPLFNAACNFITNSDSIALSSSRYVLLQLCNSKDPIIIKYIEQHIPKKQIIQILNCDNYESYDFINDLMNVAPTRLLQFIRTEFRQKLMDLDIKNPLKFVEYFQNYYQSKQLKQELCYVINKRIMDFDFTNHLSLGLLNECLNLKLLYFDTGFALGLIPKYSLKLIPTFSSPPNSINNKNNNNNSQNTVCDQINSIISDHKNVILLKLCISIFEKIYPAPPPIFFDLLHKISLDIKKFLSEQHILAFAKRNELNHIRCDLQYLKSLKTIENDDLNDPFIQVMHLFLIQKSLNRWIHSNSPLISVITTTAKGENQVFKDINENEIILTKNELIMNDKTYKLIDIFSQMSNKKNVDISIYEQKENFQGKRKSSMQSFETKIEIEFPTQILAETFQKEIQKLQYKIIELILISYGV